MSDTIQTAADKGGGWLVVLSGDLVLQCLGGCGAEAHNAYSVNMPPYPQFP